jgi:hypothetical protein
VVIAEIHHMLVWLRSARDKVSCHSGLAVDVLWNIEPDVLEDAAAAPVSHNCDLPILCSALRH